VPDVPSSADYDAILPAPNGRLWFSRKNEHGIDIFNPQTARWEGAPKDLRGHPMLFDAQGNLWVKDYPTGFWIVAPDGTETHIAERQGFPREAYLRGVAFGAGGEVWLGTTAGVALFDGAQVGPFFQTADTGLEDDLVLAMHAANDGSLWVSSETHASLARRKPDGTWERFGADNPFVGTVGKITDIAEDESGAIWVATSWDGVYRYAKGEWTQFTYAEPGVKLPSPHVRAITFADGSLWFGTDAGAARFDGTTWTAFTQVGPEALISGVVQDIYVDSTGAVYFATDGGITQWKP
jgi:ligand-binding sensor domain-containing protein